MDCVCKFCPIKIRLQKSEKDVPSVSYFRFPKDRVLARKWTIFCRKKLDFEAKKAKLCSIHFKSEDLIENVPYKLGFSNVRWNLRPDAVPCIATEDDLEREKERLENQNKIYRKKLVDQIINVAMKETLNEPTMPIEEETESPMSDPIGTELSTLSGQDSRSSNTTFYSCSVNNNEYLGETPESKRYLDENIDFEQDPIEEIDDEAGLYKEINILLKRYRMKGAIPQFNMVLRIKREFYELNIKHLGLQENKNKLDLVINDFNESIERDKDYLNNLKEQLEECQPYEIHNRGKSRRRRLWTRVEIETALEEFLNNGRLYKDRFRTECIPSVRTLQKWRLEHYPTKKRPKYKLICQEDTIERGVKNLGFEVETPKTPKLPALFPDVVPNPEFIFPEDNPERGVAELLDPEILSLNGVMIYDNSQFQKNVVDQTKASLSCVQNNNNYSDEIDIVCTYAH